VNPIDLAIDLGYLDGIKMEGVSDYKGGTESIQLVGTGVVDVGWSFNGALVKAHAKDVKLVSVVSNYGSDDVTNISAFVLADSEIREARDLIGKKIGVNVLGAHMEFIIKEYMMQAGLTKKEIEEVQLVTIPHTSAEQALRARQLDVVLLMGAAKDLLLDRGGVRELFSDVEVIGQHFTAGNYFFSKKFVEEKPELVRRFTEAIARTIEWSRVTPREEVISRMERIIQERNPHESIDNLKYWKSFGIAGEGGLIQDEEMQIWIDWLVANGELKEGEVKPQDLYTNEFNPYAKK
jgi:ABC-type nitrate/sulfonate/bicarbonate transport system substrate-binding protein